MHLFTKLSYPKLNHETTLENNLLSAIVAVKAREKVKALVKAQVRVTENMSLK